MSFGKKLLQRLVRIVAVAVIAFLLFTVIKGWADIYRMQQQINMLNERFLALQNEKAELTDLLSADEKDIVERYARHKYHFSYPGETIYHNITK